MSDDEEIVDDVKGAEVAGEGSEEVGWTTLGGGTRVVTLDYLTLLLPVNAVGRVKSGGGALKPGVTVADPSDFVELCFADTDERFAFQRTPNVRG